MEGGREGGRKGCDVPVLGGGKGAGLEEGEGQAVDVVEGEAVEGGEDGSEGAEKVLNVIA